jgi:hypothetical protein
LSSRAVGGNGGVLLGHGKPIFRGSGATPNMYSMLPHKQNIVTQSRILLSDVYGVCIDDMLLAVKLRVWKQWADFHQGLGK